MDTLKSRALALTPEIVALRRDLHAHPELSLREVRTSALIRRELEDMGVDEILSPTPTGVVGVLYGKKGPGKCVAVRADIDALPVEEKTNLPFASTVPGAMHACGHDLHTSMLLGLARLLCGMRDSFAGAVKFIFEPGEENLPGGARDLIAAGCMENPHVDAIYGVHVMPSEKNAVGKFELYKGQYSSSLDLIEITINGRSGHGSAPHTADDALVCASYLVTALQQIISRRVNPFDMAVLSIGTMTSGEAFNIIPGQAKLAGTSRCYTAESRQMILDQLDKVCEGFGIAFGCQIELNKVLGYDSIHNDSGLIDLAARVLTDTLGPDSWCYASAPFSASEDFSFYGSMTDTPEAFFLVYAGHGEELVPLHNAKCVFDEAIIPSTITGMAAIVLETLK